MGALRQLGTHLLVELVGCRFETLDDLPGVRRALITAAQRARATVLDDSFHRFSPQGLSGVVVLAESHISIHTWPEQGYAAVDVFTCGDQAMPQRAVDHLVAALAPARAEVSRVDRGIPEPRLEAVAAGGGTALWETA